ncbi:P-loop containing nucleoside triphosphate hydrolase protein [Massariosphaeria phaeospora]|uniref:P-loop containing nucleoside triphosphate hydrolase protein n=1 Tax=Massariosphaeria phaeospora TaxID=100035 RepID=A0A7C8MB53_9PLEO|nr:P-loop containing nucleoside triphosphate hydrolase protein [Massariosphaeria phaeospora]
MDEQVHRLIHKVWDKFEDVPRSKRFLVAISGIPGSGKTTLAAVVTQGLNALHAQKSPGTHKDNPLAAFVPLDGYHLTRAQLDAMPDPDSAHARRGAHFTFDGESFTMLVKKLREPLLPETYTIHAPSFDHATKDPVANDIAIAPSVRIVVFEGNYLSLNKSPWKESAQLMDELWFVEVDFSVARRRLVSRHVKAGLAENEEDAGKRADENDLVNGREILENRMEVHEVIHSIDDSYWGPETQNTGKEPNK